MTANFKEEDLISDIRQYSWQLALKMCGAGITRVKYAVNGNKYRSANQWDQFFLPTNEPQDQIIRRTAPLKQNGKIWMFKHKSYQEYYIAEWIYINITEHMNLILDEETLRILWNIINSPGKADPVLTKAFSVKNGVIDHEKLRFAMNNNFEPFKRNFSELIEKKLNPSTENSTTELAANIVDQLRFLMMTVERGETQSIVDLIKTTPAVAERFLFEKTSCDKFFRDKLFGILELSKWLKCLGQFGA